MAIGEEVAEDKSVIASMEDPAEDTLIEAEGVSTAKPASAIREAESDDGPLADAEGAAEGDPLGDITGGLANVTKPVDAAAAAVGTAGLDKGAPAADPSFVGMLMT